MFVFCFIVGPRAQGHVFRWRLGSFASIGLVVLLAGNCGYTGQPRHCTTLFVFWWVVATIRLSSSGVARETAGTRAGCQKLFVCFIFIRVVFVGPVGRLLGNCKYPCQPN